MKESIVNQLGLVSSGIATFVRSEYCPDLDKLDAEYAVIGFPCELTNACRTGSKESTVTIRNASRLYICSEPCFDIETKTNYFGPEHKIVDCGDFDIYPGDVPKTVAGIERVVRQIAAKGSIPIAFGGDDMLPIPIVNALSMLGDLCVIQIDAHLDWCDERGGQRIGQSSNSRRIREMAHVKDQVQIGTRGPGSTSQQSYLDACAAGDIIITARQFHRDGVVKVLQQIPDSKHYYLAFDIDALDPSIAPGTTAPAPGGLLYDEWIDLIEGICKKGKIVGMNVCEVCPTFDCADLTSLIAARVILDMIMFNSNCSHDNRI